MSDIAEVLLGKLDVVKNGALAVGVKGSVSGLCFSTEGLSSYATDFNRNDCIDLQLLLALMEKSRMPHTSATDGLEAVNT